MMAQAGAIPAPRIGPFGWALIAFRLVLMILLLLVCAPLHLLWRLIGLDRFWPRVFLSGVGMVAGLHIRTTGRRQRGALLLSNHVSWLDILALSQTANSAFVAHDGLAAFPLLRWLCEMNETVFIARHRRTSVGEQVAQIREALDHGGTLTLFPEGTTGDGTELGPFKSALLSAFEPRPEGAAIQPVLLEYEDVPRIAWVGEEPGLDNFKRILARLRPVRLTVHFFEPLAGEDLADRKRIAAAAQEVIGSALRRQRSAALS